MRCAAIVLVLYSMSMVFYGAAEMMHDFLHYLAEYHQSTLHSHKHEHHHNVHDHDHHHHGKRHAHVSHHSAHNETQDESTPPLVNFFLFFQHNQDFKFEEPQTQCSSENTQLAFSPVTIHPSTPPPR